MKLKTLKDLEIHHTVTPRSKTSIFVGDSVVGRWNQQIVQPSDLREEAIKHIKEIEHKKICDMSSEATVWWIKRFFNITKEDLK